LVELKLDRNQITAISGDIFAAAAWGKLKSLSLESNQITSSSRSGTPQTLPAGLFTSTCLHDLNLKGNPLQKRELMDFDGFEKFLERREGVKKKDLDGGAMVNLTLCGLD